MRVLVTGASGFVGEHLVKHLLEKGHDVRGVSRQRDCSFPKENKYEHVTLSNPFSIEAWRPITSGMDAVVHLIAKTHSPERGKLSELPDYRHINVDITKAVLEASQEAGLKRFIYMSSIKAVGEETVPGEAFSENSPCNPSDSYGISKREAEELILNYSEKIGTVILRPPLIYGPGVKGNFLRLLKLVEKGYPLPFGSLNNARSMLYVGNLVQAIVTCLGSDKATGQIFHIADNETPSTKELVLEIGRALEKRTCLIPVPISVLRMASSLTGRDREISKLTNSLVLSTEKITKTIGWETTISTKFGIETTCYWFKNCIARKGKD